MRMICYDDAAATAAAAHSHGDNGCLSLGQQLSSIEGGFIGGVRGASLGNQVSAQA